ncbi:MAG: VWA domain-containing protein, partial [Deltaproteobacteria bacterium]|nr:VWA domain-containing protein [Deltaproteobacteria bacterium]
VLDRSGSMKDPVPKRAVVTGKTPASHVPGDTKLEVAKNQLARTISKIDKNVKFAVVFYSHDVAVWRKPPGLMPGEPVNRRDATAWFMRLDPVGSTMTFDALAKALEFAKVAGGKSATDPHGADTIFLLSDGAPTDIGGNAALTGAALEEKVQEFLKANRAFGCVVHTIGVGPLHNAKFMRRLAAETGGTYKAVGVR